MIPRIKEPGGPGSPEEGYREFINPAPDDFPPDGLAGLDCAWLEARIREKNKFPQPPGFRPRALTGFFSAI